MSGQICITTRFSSPVTGIGRNAVKIRQDLHSLEFSGRITCNARQLLENKIEIPKVERLIDGLNQALLKSNGAYQFKPIEHIKPETRDLAKELGLGFIISKTYGWQLAAPKDLEELFKIKSKLNGGPQKIAFETFPIEVLIFDGTKRIEQGYKIVYKNYLDEIKCITGRTLGNPEDMIKEILERENQAYNRYQELEIILS